MKWVCGRTLMLPLLIKMLSEEGNEFIMEYPQVFSCTWGSLKFLFQQKAYARYVRRGIISLNVWKDSHNRTFVRLLGRLPLHAATIFFYVIYSATYITYKCMVALHNFNFGEYIIQFFFELLYIYYFGKTKSELFFKTMCKVCN